MVENKEEYSQILCSYMGKIELKASQCKDSYGRYATFRDALEFLPRDGLSGLSDNEKRLVKNILENKVRETEPWNIGCASGEAGEAD